jgi:hypothetical protein
LAQLTTANVRAANQIRITFNEEIRYSYPVDLLAFINNFSAKGINGVNYTWGDIDYDRDSHTAIFTLDAAVHPNGFQFTQSSVVHRGDKLLITLLSSGLRDIAGNDLDGEWTNPTGLTSTGTTNFPSGNGVAGGNFAFRVVMLPGDPNRDNMVNLTDHGIVSGNFGVAGGWSIGNFDADATVDLDDFGMMNTNFGYNWNTWGSTPAGPGAPMAPRPDLPEKLLPKLTGSPWKSSDVEAELELLAAARIANEEPALASTAAGWWAAYSLDEDDEEAEVFAA